VRPCDTLCFVAKKSDMARDEARDARIVVYCSTDTK
jgi:hypothetical protein